MIQNLAIVSVLTISLPAAMLLPTSALAQDCRIYQVPDFCSVLWSAETDFWSGIYSVAAGPVSAQINGQPFSRPAEPVVDVTVFQIGQDLAISHPEGMLDAQYQPLDPGEEPFVWPQNFAGNNVLGDAISFDLPEYETAQGCDNQQMPRWQAAVPAPDGPVTTVELTAVTFDTILGRLYYEGPWQDAHIWFERRVELSRPAGEIDPAEYPDLFEIIDASGEVCSLNCGTDASWICAD